MEAGMMKTVLTNKSARSNRHYPLHRVEAGKIFRGNTRGKHSGGKFQRKNPGGIPDPLSSTGSYSVSLAWSGGAFWTLLRPTSEIFATTLRIRGVLGRG